MNMKKLIEEADFDNVEQISKRWKKQVKGSPAKQSAADLAQILNTKVMHKENLHDSNILKTTHHAEKDTSHFNVETSTSAQSNNRKRSVIPQVIDEDTQHFKNRLEHLLNSFKTDAVGEFMGMKKSMLEYQKDTIKSDTQKYLQMYEEKHQELLTTKQSLIEASKDLEKKTIQVELMSSHICKLNDRIKAIKYLSKPFSLLYENKVQQQTLKVKYTQAERNDNRRIKVKAFSGWRNIWREVKQQKDKENSQQRINDQVKDIVNRLNKEMQMLREQLNEANRKNQEYENNKMQVQQNLKKTFLRGMCAMNMEAMGVLSGDLSISQQGNSSMMQPNVSMNQMMNMSHLTQQNHAQTAKNLGHSQLSYMTHEKQQYPSTLGNTSIYMGKVKTESKQHKWKQAPIMGIEQNEDYEEPRPILVKPSTQGKVIKIIDGKSSTVDSKKVTPSPSNVCSRTNLNTAAKQSNKQGVTNRSTMMNSRKN